MNKFKTLQDLCPAGVMGRMMTVDDFSSSLSEGELDLIRGAHENRIRGFSSARKLAKEALMDLGCPVKELAARPDRTPDWPSQVIGSISHHENSAGVIVAKSSADLLAIGLDLEILQETHPNLEKRVMTENEMENTRRLSPNFSASCLTTFCLKEASYKAMFKFNNEGLSFQDIEFSAWNWEEFFCGEIQTPEVTVLEKIAERLPAEVGLRARVATHGVEVMAVVWVCPS
jgi:4'-phosphopantetheinyl transferase EntD